MSKSLQVLAENRDALLLAEVAGWLHMFGKLHEEFLYGNHDMDRQIPKDVQVDYLDLYKLLTTAWSGYIWKTLPVPEFQAEKLSIFDIIKYHRTSLKYLEEGFLKLVVDAHGRGSGTEKGILDRFAPGQEKTVYPLTSLGYESPSFIALPSIHTVRYCFYDFLETFLCELRIYLENLEELGDEGERIKNWVGFRKRFLYWLELSFRLTVADTRRPLNDVTLQAQTAASVAFFKAALSQNILEGWKEPDQKKVEDKYHWRFLKVGLDSLTFLENSVRISDILARKNLIERVLDEVQMALEVTYPLGMEVYRDENGSIFIVPDIDNLHTEIYVDRERSLEKYIQDMGYRGFSNETTFTLCLIEKGTRNTLSFGSLAARTITLATPKFDLERWQNVKEDICPICSIRPQGPDPKALSRRACNECQKRRTNRSEKWLEDPSSTIWIDEVADINGRFALIAAQFDIVNWLSGTSFNTVLAFDPKSRSVFDSDRKQSYNFNFSVLVENIQERLRRDTTTFKKEKRDLLDLLVLEKSRDQSSNTVRAFYNLRILGTDLESISALSEPERLALEMLRLSPAFSRVYRIWQTTQTFWKDMVFDFMSTIGRVSPRLRVKANSPLIERQDTLGISHTYELKIDGVNLSVVYEGDGQFISVDNLPRTVALLTNRRSDSYSKAAKYIGDRLIELETVPIEEPTGYGNPNKPLGTLQITGEVLLEQTPYIPAITILTEPRTFMALVPADKALNVAEAIRAKYEQEMSKVRNRLPLTIGIVFAGRRTPLPAILDAGRRMLEQPTQVGCWTVRNIQPPLPRSSWPSRIKLTLEKDGQTLPLEIETIMGDGETKDVWYPYWCVERDKNGPLKPFSRTRQFTGIDKKEWVHVCDLQVGDEVEFMPSRFDFEFLDPAARRFEVSYESDKRRGSIHPCRPFYLEQLTEFKELWEMLSNRDGLTITQIHNLLGFIENQRMEWAGQDKSVFEQIVRDALDNAEWKTHPRKHLDPEKFEQLCQAAINGQLSDVVELYMRILKRKPELDQDGGNQ